MDQLLREWPPGFGGVERVAPRLALALNGKVFTEDSTANYRFSIEDCVSEASKYFTLEPGDIISFGTTGKGNADFPRGHKSVLLGEVSGEITIEVPELGTLRNTIFHKTGGL